MKHKKRWLIVLCVLVVLSAACFIYVETYSRAGQEAQTVLQAPAEGVTIEESKDRIVFTPREPVAGLIFYPGGKVEYTAYAPLMEELAQQGILCVLLHMPCNLAILDMSAGEGIARQYPELDWYIGGHSLGGVAAASYAAGEKESFAGLILLASYANQDISHMDMGVLSIFGTQDGVMNRNSYEKNRVNLPADAVEYVIEGGCHAGFADYGPQKGDGEPAVSGQEQRQRTAREIARFITSEQ